MRHAEIAYRPELAKKMANFKEFVMSIYNANYKAVYYKLVGKYLDKTDKEAKEFFNNVAKCFEDGLIGHERFYEYYEKDMLTKYNVAEISDSRAAYIVYKVYEYFIEDEYKKLLSDDLNEAEKYMIKDFKNILTGAMFRNPNIVPKEETNKNYYESTPYDSFSTDLKRSIEFINNNTKHQIELFNTPDFNIEER